jgi:hypothetical protein
MSNFEIRISSDARALILKVCQVEGHARPGLMVHRQGPKGDVTRLPTGEASWSVERPYPWCAQVGDFATIDDTAEDVHVVDGVRVWLALIPKPGELGVTVTVRDQALHVEGIK